VVINISSDLKKKDSSKMFWSFPINDYIKKKIYLIYWYVFYNNSQKVKKNKFFLENLYLQNK
jgi:predicted double-glycine peptidase